MLTVGFPVLFACSSDFGDEPKRELEQPGKHYILPSKIVMLVWTGDMCSCTDSVFIDFTYDNDRVIAIDRLTKYNISNYKPFKDSVFEHFQFKYLDKELHIDVTDENETLVSHGVFFFSDSLYAFPTSFEYQEYDQGNISESKSMSFSYTHDNYLQVSTPGGEFDSLYVDDDNIYFEYEWYNEVTSYSDLPAPFHQFSGFDWYGYDYKAWSGWKNHRGPNPLMYPLKLFKASKNLSNKDIPPNRPGRNDYSYVFESDTLRSINFEREDSDLMRWQISLSY